MLVQLGLSGVCQRRKLCVETLHTHSSSVRVHGLLGNLPMSCQICHTLLALRRNLLLADASAM